MNQNLYELSEEYAAEYAHYEDEAAQMMSGNFPFEQSYIKQVELNLQKAACLMHLYDGLYRYYYSGNVNGADDWDFYS